MKRKIILFISALVLAILACRATENAPPMQREFEYKRVTISPLAPRLCRVNTGFEGGKVNLRTCHGTRCSVIAVLHEDEILTQIHPQAVDGWLLVMTESRVNGWVNSKYCKGE